MVNIQDAPFYPVLQWSGAPQDHCRAGIIWVVDHSEHCGDAYCGSGVLMYVVQVETSGLHTAVLQKFLNTVSSLRRVHRPKITVDQ